MSTVIDIEVVYGLPEKQTLLSLSVDEGTTVEKAIQQSGILSIYSIDIEKSKVGVWNRSCKLSQVLSDGDRIEIYRPLIADPKEVRKRRAEKAKEEGRADKVTGGRPSNAKSTRPKKASINDTSKN
ncbi:RnfH family protein [Glaciecola sp. MH2013]|uniref:RnfH family protein n=1 Tax=Glaciecola sp. MH2013 TaxID=2785524 RepID=UPI00189EA3D6|nr:RnfH family protein [Glaciecola sp. MH2013]MBF7073001.1 RnfH family protein [Glaciecola sp. MH2013]